MRAGFQGNQRGSLRGLKFLFISIKKRAGLRAGFQGNLRGILRGYWRGILRGMRWMGFNFSYANVH